MKRQDEARKAVEELDKFEIQERRRIKVKIIGVYILHKIYFFFPATKIFIFSPPSFLSPSRGKMEKYLKNSIFYLFYPSYHTFFQFFHQGWGGNGKNVFSFLNFYIFFSPPTTYFLFFSPLLSWGSHVEYTPLRELKVIIH